MSEIVRWCVAYALKGDSAGRLAGSVFGRRVMMLVTGTLGGHVVMAAVTPVVSRLYTPQDFAVIGIFISLLSLLVVVSDGGYSRAALLPDSDGVAACALVLGACMVGATTGATVIGVWLFKDQLAVWTNAPVLSRYLWWLPLMVLAAGLYHVGSFWAIRRHAYHLIARVRVELSAGQAVTIVALGLAKIGGVGLIIGDAVGAVIGACRLAAFAWRGDSLLLRRVTGAGLRSVAGRYAYFPLFAMPATFLQSLQTKIPILLIAAFYGAHAAGSLTFAHGLIWVLTTVVSDTVAQVYLGRGAELARHHPEQLRRLFNRTARLLLTTLAPPLVLLGVVSPPLFAAVFGGEWLDAGHYVRSLVPALLARLVVGPIFQTLTILERQAWVFWTNATSVGLITAGFVLSHLMGLTADRAVDLYSASVFLTYAALFFLARKAIGSALNASADGLAAGNGRWWHA